MICAIKGIYSNDFNDDYVPDIETKIVKLSSLHTEDYEPKTYVEYKNVSSFSARTRSDRTRIPAGQAQLQASWRCACATALFSTASAGVRNSLTSSAFTN